MRNIYMFELSLSDGTKFTQAGFFSQWFAEVSVEQFRDFVEDRGLAILSVLIRQMNDDE